MMATLINEGDGSWAVGRVEMRVKGKIFGRSNDASAAGAGYA